jgi:GNAT superfamily N-acetyltransferase
MYDIHSHYRVGVSFCRMMFLRMDSLLMNLLVERASGRDLIEAEAVMREVLNGDLGGYVPAWHADLDDLASAYLSDPKRSLFVARVGETLVGTAAVKPCALRTPPNPQWLAERYNDPSVCELARVWIAPAGRRQGVGRALVRRATQWATREAGYQTVYLHTNTSSPGAEPFWRSLPTVEVYDAGPDPFNCVHFEVDVAKLCDEVIAL